jgi:MoaA/NifB/PqqE/SkfB family radical SAM enzyme
LKVNCVILPENLDHLVEMRQIAREMGVEELNFQHPMFDTAENIGLHNRVFAKAMGSAAIENTDLAKGPGEYFETLFTEEQFQRIEAALDTVLADKGRLPHVMLFPSVSRARWREYYLNLGHAFKKECGAPWTTMRLLADGVFEPCLRWRVGNVRETPIWDLWNHQRARDFRVELRRSGLFPACARCCYRRY